MGRKRLGRKRGEGLGEETLTYDEETQSNEQKKQRRKIV